MLGILIDAAVLMVLLQSLSDAKIGVGTSVVIALVAAIAATILAFGLGMAIGVAGIFLAVVIAAAALGAAVSAMYGVEIKRVFLIGGSFVVVHVGIGIAFQSMLHA